MGGWHWCVRLGTECRDGKLALVSVWLQTECRDRGGGGGIDECLARDRVPRWEAGIGECLARDGVPRREAVIGDHLASDEVPRWEAGIGEFLSRGRSAEMGGWQW